MKKIIQGLLLLLLLTSTVLSFAEEIKMVGLVAKPVGGSPKTGQTTSYPEGDLTDRDDGYYQKSLPAVGTTHYQDNGNGTITDNATGLMWVQDPSRCGGIEYLNNKWATALNTPRPMIWADAITNCEDLDYAGYTDWRLPNIRELMSIVDYGKKQPSIDPIFINLWSTYYWSSTTYFAFTFMAWIVNFYDGYVGQESKTSASWVLVRPARGGRNSE